jgi:hypothetical protein
LFCILRERLTSIELDYIETYFNTFQCSNYLYPLNSLYFFNILNDNLLNDNLLNNNLLNDNLLNNNLLNDNLLNDNLLNDNLLNDNLLNDNLLIVIN